MLEKSTVAKHVSHYKRKLQHLNHSVPIHAKEAAAGMPPANRLELASDLRTEDHK